MYYVRRTDSKHYLKQSPKHPAKHAVDQYGNPQWTPEQDDALGWSKPDGAQAWLEWWRALGKDPQNDAEVQYDKRPAASAK